MKRQTNTELATRVYSYGALPARLAPVRNEEGAIAQMRLAGYLWNTLVAIERARHERYIKIMADAVSTRIGELKASIDGAREEICARRKTARKRAVDLGSLPDDIKAWRAERRGLIEQQQASKDARHAERRVELDKLADVTRRRIVKARQAAAHMGLFWGTYNDVIQRADAGRKLGKLQFHRFRGMGTLTAQIMGGMAVSRVDEQGGNNFFRLGPWLRRGDDSAVHHRWARYAMMRIGSTADRSPVWLEIPIVFHRDLPPDGVIKSVSMTRRGLAEQVKWQLNVTVSAPKPAAKEGPAIAVDIGWRLLPDGAVRVAYWVDEGGRSGQVTVAASDIGQFGRVASLRSLCDRKRDEFLPPFAAWLGKLQLPDEWKQRAAHIALWCSSDRLAALIRWWADHRLPDDGGWFYGAREWRQKYMHLSNWHRNLGDQLTLRVREQYRVWAAGVARSYGTAVIETFDLREVAEIPQPEGEAPQPAANSIRQQVSPSTLRAALKNACQREGVTVAELPAAWTTAECHRCTKRCEWDHAELMHRCEHCGAQWDQDENAARNLLRLWLAAKQSAVTV